MLREKLVRALLAASCVVPTITTGGCLVASDPDFRGQDECMPTFVNRDAVPALTATTLIASDGSEPQEFVGTVPMRSCALIQNYEARVFVAGQLKQIVPVYPSGGETRNVPVVADVSGLAPGCYFVEVLISSRFGADLRLPERAGDLAYFAWPFTNDPDALFTQCGGQAP